MEEWKGGLDIPTEGGARVGGRGGSAGLGKIEEVGIRMGKKRGEERRTERAQWVWKISWPERRLKRKPRGRLAKRRRVTVTEDGRLDRKREAQDEASRIGTKPSGVMTR